VSLPPSAAGAAAAQISVPGSAMDGLAGSSLAGVPLQQPSAMLPGQVSAVTVAAAAAATVAGAAAASPPPPPSAAAAAATSEGLQQLQGDLLSMTHPPDCAAVGIGGRASSRLTSSSSSGGTL